MLCREDMGLTLEVGSGLSPVATITDRIVYTDLSFSAVRRLRQNERKGWYIVADATHLPFKKTSFSHVIASEVLEHLPDDSMALREMAAVMKRSGRLIITFPHRRVYFALDDRFVHHFRRYDLHEMSEKLAAAGLYPVVVKKVLGPLEKVTMMAMVGAVHLVRKLGLQTTVAGKEPRGLVIMALFFKWANRFYAGLVWLEALIMPRNLSSVLLIMAEKGNDRD
ncbi:MAG: class I SAM-dependent methyltransferase [Pseudomonadota bacterium]